MKTVLAILVSLCAVQVFATPTCMHQLIDEIEKEKNLIGDISDTREALREYRSALNSLGKQITSSLLAVTKETAAAIKELIEKLQQQGLTPEEEANLQQLIKQARANINEIVKTNLLDLKNIRMSIAALLDDLVYDHSQIPADIDKLNANLKIFQENVIVSTGKINEEIVVVRDEFVRLMNVHAQEMTGTILEGMEKIRKTILDEYKNVKEELVEVRTAEAVVIEAVKKVLSHFDPTATEASQTTASSLNQI